MELAQRGGLSGPCDRSGFPASHEETVLTIKLVKVRLVEAHFCDCRVFCRFSRVPEVVSDIGAGIRVVPDHRPSRAFWRIIICVSRFDRSEMVEV